VAVELAKPPHETAEGRRKLAAKGQTAYGTSYPVPNVAYLKKALQAVGRVAPGKRAKLGAFLRKRARELGAWSVIKGSWADNTGGAKTMAQALHEALELSRADGTLWELHHRVDLAGPKGYVHGWKYVGGPGLPKTLESHARKVESSHPRAAKYLRSAAGHLRSGDAKKAYGHLNIASGEFKRKHPKSGVEIADEEHPTRKAAVKAMNRLHRVNQPRRGPSKRNMHLHQYANGDGQPIDLVGPKGYIHGWIYVGGGKKGHKAKLGDVVRVSRMAGPAEGQVIHREAGGGIHIRTRKGRRIETHEGMVTHVKGPVSEKEAGPGGRGPQKLSPEDAATTLRAYESGRTGPRDEYGRPTTNPAALKRLRARAAESETPSVEARVVAGGGKKFPTLASQRIQQRGQRAMEESKRARGIKEGTPGVPKRPLRIAGKRMTGSQESDFNGLSETNKDIYEERRQEGLPHADAMKGLGGKQPQYDTDAEAARVTKSARAALKRAGHPISSKEGAGATVSEAGYSGFPGAQIQHQARRGQAATEAERIREHKKIAATLRQRGFEVQDEKFAAGMGSYLTVKKPKKEKAARAAAPHPQTTQGGKGSGGEAAIAKRDRISAETSPETAMATYAAAKEPPGSGAAHSELLKARTAARKAYPKGHPERLKAERAVRHSRKSRRAGEGSGGGGTTGVTGTSTATRRRQRKAVPAGKTSAPETGKSIMEHRAEVGTLAAHRVRAYYTARRQGIGHERAMTVARETPEPPKGSDAARRYRKTGERKAPEKATAPVTAPAAAAPGTATPGEQALAKKYGVSVAQIRNIKQMAKALQARGWSQTEARKIAIARVTKGTPIPQFAPGKKGPRER
jgi:hypothetical protein